VSDHHAEKETIFETDSHVMPSVGNILTTFVVLAVLAVVALAVGFSDLGPNKVLFSLAVTAVQSTILGLFWMDLKQADKLTWLCVGASIFWVGLQFLFTLTDHITRHYAAY
jgi:caa(3)-type oxidase subunit IV